MERKPPNVEKSPIKPIPFGRYLLLEHLATGGMAEIFRATAQGAYGFEKTVVIKRILPNLAKDKEFLSLFVDEAKVMVRLSHPKIVSVLDFGEVDGRYYIAMEYVEGTDGLGLLRNCAKQRTRPSTGIAVHVVAEVLDALDHAHHAVDDEGQPLGIIHRDISPSNIFVSRYGEVKLGDFGIAQMGVDSAANMRGKYGYMAPEQVAGKHVDERSDVFACGIVLAELLMVRRLFMAANDIEVLLQVRDARLDRLDQFGSHIPDELRAILLSALARDPDLRYQSAAAFRDALQRYLFDNRRMVRAADVQAFMKRIFKDQLWKKTSTGSDQPAVSVEKDGSVDAVGDKRRIRLRPPPTPRPLPSIHTSEERRIGTQEANEAIPELSPAAASSGVFFPSYDPNSDAPPALGDIEVDPRFLDESTSTEVAADEVAASRTTPIVGVPALQAPDLRGAIGEKNQPSVVRLIFRLAAEEETGLLMLTRGNEVKEIYFVDGDPRSVNSNRGDELFGQYLVKRRVISKGELSMALAMLPHFDGKLGDTLVALRLLRPVQVLRHLTHQVRQKLLEVFAWSSGTFLYFSGKRADIDSAPLGLDAFELIGTGVSLLDVDFVYSHLLKRRDAILTPIAPAPMPPEVFRLGRLPRQAYEKFQGKYCLGEIIDLFDAGEARDNFLRMTYLLMETGLIAQV